MHHFCRHAQAVARAADRIARELGFGQRDDLLAAALLHDVGKLALGLARPDNADSLDARRTTPEQRIREEQRALGMDHASLGVGAFASLGAAPPAREYRRLAPPLRS